MARTLLLTSAAVLLLTLVVVSYTEAYEERELRRALDALNRLTGRAQDDDDEDCKKKGEACKGVPYNKCCGELQCYWPDGYSIKKDGHCVKCVLEGNACQRDGQCCPHFQCNKGNGGWVNGKCERYRRSGHCYRDGQCVKDCVKKWYDPFNGQCT